jgi:hypothetical protein
MSRVIIICTAIAVTSCSQPLLIRGRVVDLAAHAVAGARIRGIHTVPAEMMSDPRHPRWDGLLGETRSDTAGRFVLQVSDSPSLDYILAEHDSRFGIVNSPFSEHIQIIIHPRSEQARRLRRQYELERQRKLRDAHTQPGDAANSERIRERTGCLLCGEDEG